MKKFSQLAIPYIVWAVIMLVLPMALIAFYSVTKPGNSIFSFSVTLEHYVTFFTDPDFLKILWRSLWIAVKTTIICLLTGKDVCMDRSFGRRRTDPEDFRLFRARRKRAFIYGRRRPFRNGIQLPSVYDTSDKYISL